MILNNLTGARPISTNCEQDSSVALLNNIHDLIQEFNSNVNTETSVNEAQQNELYDDVICEPQFTKQELNFFENESLSNISNVICAQIIKETYCRNCQSTLRNDSQPSDDDLYINPSVNCITKFKKIFEFATQIIPSFCSEKFLKKIVIQEVKKRYDYVETNSIEIELGCVEHNREIEAKLYEHTIDYALKIFCKNISDIITRKVNVRPQETNQIEDLAWTFRTKKSHIGKQSDIFKSF